MEESIVEGAAGAREHPFDDVHAFYRTSEEVSLARLPAGTARVVARRANGATVEAHVGEGARFAELPAGSHAIEALAAGGELLAEEMTTVGSHQGERPVHGFATSFSDGDIPAVLEWHRALRSTVVQVYDWMASYTEPLGPEGGWEDPSHRPVSFQALRALSAGLAELGAVAHAYAPVYAVGNAFAAVHPEMLMYRGDGEPSASSTRSSWQTRERAMAAPLRHRLRIGGGHPRFHRVAHRHLRLPAVAQDMDGNAIDMRAAYESFLSFLRAARPADLISFNQVDGVPSAAVLPGSRAFATARCGLRTTPGAIWKACWTAAREERAPRSACFTRGRDAWQRRLLSARLGNRHPGGTCGGCRARGGSPNGLVHRGDRHESRCERPHLR